MINFYKRLSYCWLAAGLFATSATKAQEKTVVAQVYQSADDAEESVATGAVDLTSSDLELAYDGTRQQLIGVRFANLQIPKGVTIKSASLQFTTSGRANPTVGNIEIFGQASVNVLPFASATNNISQRTLTIAKTDWAGSDDATWGINAEGTAGVLQKTPDLKSIVQEIVDGSNWASGNALAFVMKGQGVRNAHSYDGSSAGAPTLTVVFERTNTALAAEPFPIAKKSEWKYLDNGTNQGVAYTALAFDDAAWQIGYAKLGYSDAPATTLSFGSDANNKYVTTYFRKKFSVADVNTIPYLKLSILADDAAAVYINGNLLLRHNLPQVFDYLTFSNKTVDGTDESTYYDYLLPATDLVNGENVIAVEIHQVTKSSSDIGFDMALSAVAAPQNCATLDAQHITNFLSVLPSAQPDSLRIPSTHTFQMLMQDGTPYTNPADGNMKGTFDFTAYVPINGSSTNGYLSLNHEQGSFPAAGVTIFDINYNASTKLWQTTNTVPVDFSGAAGTGRNCSGGITPWNTIVTSEEILPTIDANGDGHQDIGWLVEIDPATRKIKDYNNDGRPDKIFKAGRMSHENAVIAQDRKTLYEGNDDSDGYIWKYVANTAEDLSDGNLYVLKINKPSVVSVSSSHVGDGSPASLVDGVISNSSFWHSNYGTATAGNTRGYPIDLVINVGTATPAQLEGVRFAQRQNNVDGYAKDIDISVSLDNITYTKVASLTLPQNTDAFDYKLPAGAVAAKFYKVTIKSGKSAVYTNLSECYPLLAGAANSASTGEWIQVPNSTPQECNTVRAFAGSVGATNFQNVEDVEINPVNNMIYFTSKTNAQVYRFTDLGNTVSDFSSYVGISSKTYNIAHANGVAAEAWGGGNDNLTFDEFGNLYVLQDGGRNHIWMVKACHTPDNPQVELFAVTPAGCEPTGMTFSPDHKFMFVSFQHPSSSNATEMTDASGNKVKFNKESMVVIARKEYLGNGTLAISFNNFEAVKINDNTAKLSWAFHTDQNQVTFEVERMVEGAGFVTLKKLTGVDSKLGQNIFQFEDQKPQAGNNYYRIKSIDKDGLVKYTEVKMLRFANLDKEGLKIFPNPVSTTLNLDFEVEADATASIMVFNNAGAMLKQQSLKVTKGRQHQTLNVADLPTGVYHVSVMVNGIKQAKTFIKH